MGTLQIGMRVKLPDGGRCWGCGDGKVRACQPVTICGVDDDGTLFVARVRGGVEWAVTPLEVGCVVAYGAKEEEEGEEAC